MLRVSAQILLVLQTRVSQCRVVLKNCYICEYRKRKNFFRLAIARHNYPPPHLQVWVGAPAPSDPYQYLSSRFLNDSRSTQDCKSFKSDGSRFHARGAATEKSLSVTDLNLSSQVVLSTTICHSDEREGMLEAGVNRLAAQERVRRHCHYVHKQPQLVRPTYQILWSASYGNQGRHENINDIFKRKYHNIFNIFDIFDIFKT